MLDAELITHNLCTQEFHIIENFLPLNEYQALQNLAYEVHHSGLLKTAKIGPTAHAQQNNTIRTDSICWLDEDSSEESVLAYLKITKQLANLLNQTLFLGLTEFETHFAVYPAGAYYKRHVDQFATKKNRKISCVYYLNDNWQEHFGGELKLYSREDQLLQTVFPRGNRFICFNSELPHEVCLTHQPRFSIAGWMKTAETYFRI